MNQSTIALEDDQSLSMREKLALIDARHMVECFVLPFALFGQFAREMGLSQKAAQQGVGFTFVGTPVIRGSRFMVGVRAVFS